MRRSSRPLAHRYRWSGTRSPGCVASRWKTVDQGCRRASNSVRLGGSTMALASLRLELAWGSTQLSESPSSTGAHLRFWQSNAGAREWAFRFQLRWPAELDGGKLSNG